jgi:hypothetical protein
VIGKGAWSLRGHGVDGGLSIYFQDFKHLFEPSFVRVFAMSAGIRTVGNFPPFFRTGEVIIDFFLQFLLCLKRHNFLPGLEQIRKRWLPIRDLEGSATGGLE